MALYRELVTCVDPKALYDNLQKIGQGATGSIYKASQKSNSQEVAIKEMKFSRSNLPLLLNEIDILRNCKHECVIEYYSAYKKGQTLWVFFFFFLSSFFRPHFLLLFYSYYLVLLNFFYKTY